MRPNNIAIKTERQVERVLGIKRENDSQNSGIASKISSVRSQPNTNTWVQEKNSFIEKIVDLKSENQRLMLDLKGAQNIAETTTERNRILMKKLAESEKIYSKLEKVHAELTKSNATQERVNEDRLKRIGEVTRERDLLRAQFKQLQNGFARQSEEKKPNDCDDDRYEVERLLDDERIQTQRFLVRWKGYDSSHDSWVNENDLNCPRILKRYIQSKKKQP